MFSVLQRRVRALTGTSVCSFDDLQELDLDSVDSICLSDTLINNTDRVSGDPALIDNSYEVTNENRQRVESYCKHKVITNIKSIKKLEKIRQGCNARINMLTFFDLLHDQQYQDVGMGLLSQFINECKIIPKSYYLHYYMYFLCYASYYHYTRYNVDILDTEMTKIHKYLLLCTRYQLKILQYIIDKSRIHG